MKVIGEELKKLEKNGDGVINIEEIRGVYYVKMNNR
jgi:hypothetical protein